jgi:hypothetical protein
MTLEQALLKIIELQDEVFRLHKLAALRLSQQPISIPSQWTSAPLCSSGGICEYPIMWHGVTNPPCVKCGKLNFPSFTVTSNSSDGGNK